VNVSGILRNRINWTLRSMGNRVLRIFQDDYTSASRVVTVKEETFWRGGSLLASRTSAGTRHYGLDHLGSPRILTDTTGALAGYQDFAPFGSGGTTTGGALQFTSHERDTANLAGGTADLPDYMHARYYRAGVGRFLSVDPIVQQKRAMPMPQMWNRYSYTMNNPLKLIDPTGMIIEWVDQDLKKRAAAVAKDNPKFAQQLTSLENAHETFRIQYGGDKADGEEGRFGYTGNRDNFTLTLDKKSKQFTIEQNLAHEVRHASDYLDGRIGFMKLGSTWRPVFYDIGDEVRAFQSAIGVSTPSQQSGVLHGARGDISAYYRANSEGRLANELKNRGYGRLSTKDSDVSPGVENTFKVHTP
jgi:RHS repeat-associated protein